MKYLSKINQEKKNEFVKQTIFKWCSNTKINSRNSNYWRSLDTPNEVRVVKSTLRKLRKDHDVQLHNSGLPTSRNCFSEPNTIRKLPMIPEQPAAAIESHF